MTVPSESTNPDELKKRRLVLWLLGCAVVISGAAATWVRCPGCIPRDRVNTACEWTGDTSVTVDPGNPTHWAHLVEDAQLAEELGIRYADAEHGRRFGVEHHGGLVENGRVRQACLSEMFAAIERNHGVTPDRIRAARGHRNAAFDIAVVVLFVPFYAVAAGVACRRLYGRFGADAGYVRWGAVGVASVAASLLGTQCLRLWAGVWEAIRVGNGHMTSIRLASQTHWVKQNPGSDIVVCLLLFWLVALLLARLPSPDAPPKDVRLRDGVLLG